MKKSVPILLFVCNAVFGSKHLGCQDIFFNDCQYPYAMDSVHSEKIEPCHETCKIYADIGYCDFYLYEEKQVEDENCKIYSDEDISVFKRGCNVIGMPIRDEQDNCLSYSDECSPIEEVCTNCTSCQLEPCGGFVNTECTYDGPELEKFPTTSIEECIHTCFIHYEKEARFMTYTREEQMCTCFESGSRKCQNKVVLENIDLEMCNQI